MSQESPRRPLIIEVFTPEQFIAWKQVRKAVLKAAKPYPEARQAILLALLKAEGITFEEFKSYLQRKPKETAGG